MPVSPTTGNGNSCGSGPLPDTTSRYHVGSATYDQYQQFGLDGSSPPKRTGHRTLIRQSGGRLRRNESSLRELVVRARPGIKANGRRSFRLPRNPAGHNRPPQPEKHTPLPSGKGIQKKTNQKQEQQSRKGRRGLTGSRRGNGESCLMASSLWALTLTLYRTPRGEIRV